MIDSEAPKNTRALFVDANDPNYDDVAETYGDDFINSVGSEIVAILTPQSGTHALDVGAGRGAVTRALVANRIETWAIDLSPRMIDQIQTIIPPSRCLVGDCGDLPFSNESFDSVTAGYVLTVAPDRTQEMLAEWHRVLKSGGRLAVSEPGPIHADWLWLHELAASFFKRPGPLEHNRQLKSERENILHAATQLGFTRRSEAMYRNPIRFDQIEAAFQYLSVSGLESGWKQLSDSESHQFRTRVRAGLCEMFESKNMIVVDRCAALLLFEKRGSARIRDGIRHIESKAEHLDG
ncbi:ubiquinone/menaquinone biosynthesis C-methylase UbiE [Mycetocola sp. BIGb0189]|uniref:class I SAM-dependent methyltransferase n=1 Tax=Mycetocola sp. BIGb0189 TaxID=2940604 RepID=UPI00216A3390|nr:class I SAM-dependent methyltransferase [Mycetocola sp. BIGb0189]MCS4274927.1 ubiquinone/menaquinone biosynthesis C-methylase UbiE [Mycetocola sp. BIGb0189]